jgi:hypothetical protein
VHLLPHPRGAAARLNLCASATRTGADLLLEFRLAGDLARVRWPPPAAAQRRDGLWRHTCFEAFFRRAGGAGYCELNLAPSTQWAAYAFSGYRSGMRVLDLAQPPGIEAHLGEPQALLRARVPLGPLLKALGTRAVARDEAIELSLSAVIEEQRGALGYWALRHPAPQPDFHHPLGFVAALAVPQEKEPA